ncbi:MAG: adenylate/guanylate cyclase domain-containing protein [Pseudomonadota bacterium]
MSEYGTRLVGAGVDLARMASAMPTLHSERRGFGRYWYPDGRVKDTVFQWDNVDQYRASPYFTAHETGEWVEIRPMQANESLYPIEEDLRQEGITHYICVPIFLSQGMPAGMTYSTTNPEGFSAEAIRVLRTVEPGVAVIMDQRAKQLMLDDLLRIYVGREPHDRILQGEVRRGDVMRMQSAILFADMTGFTRLTQSMTAEETAALLNAYYDCVVPSVEFNDGEVLKYIGDGVLAVFRCDDEKSTAAAVEHALQAASDIIESVGTRETAGDTGLPPFDIRVGLHVGEVAYGNVGSGARLDFTVIGSAVNLASRITDLAGTLNRQVILSSEFADQVPASSETESLGAFPLKGFDTPCPVYGLSD